MKVVLRYVTVDHGDQFVPGVGGVVMLKLHADN